MPSRRLPATVALVVWTLLVWTTRIGSVWGDADLSTGEKLGRTGLAMTFTVLALAAAHAVWHRTRWRAAAVLSLAGWTVAVWVVRATRIATADHEAGFIAVHLVLALVSIALAALATREIRTAGQPSVITRT